MSMQDKIRKEIEKSSLEDSLTRIETLVNASERPTPLQLGILLALRIGKEMQDGKAPGTDSGKLVAEWSGTYAAEVIDEAVVFARHFLTKPQELVKQISAKLDSSRDTTHDETDDAALADQFRAEDEAQ